MNIGGQRGRIGWAVVVAAIACAVVGVTGCRPTPTAASGAPTGSGTASVGGARIAHRAAPARGGGASGGACVFDKPDGARKFGHVGCGFRITGTPGA